MVEKYSFDASRDANDLNQFSMDTGQLQLSAQQAGRQASKYEFGLGDLLGNTTAQDIANQLQRPDGDNIIRNAAAKELDSRKWQAVPKLAIQNITPEAFKSALKPTDPSTVVEDRFARQFLAGNTKDEADFGTFYSDIDKDQDDYRVLHEMGHSLAGKAQVVDNTIGKAMDEHKKQGYFSWGREQLATMAIPLLGQAQARSALEHTGLLGGLLSILGNPIAGSAYQADVDKVYNLPLPEFQKEIEKIYEEAKAIDPEVALQVLRMFQQYGSSDRYLDTAFGLLDDFYAAGTVKPVMKLPVRMAFRDSLKSRIKASTALTDHGLKADAAAAAGDTLTSAKYRATGEIYEAIKGTPIELTDKVLEDLPSAYNVKMKGWEANPGRHGQEILNRLWSETKEKLADLMSAIRNSTNVLRVPLLQTQNKYMERYIEDELVPRYTGWENQILNIDLVNERATNAMFYDITFGQTSGKLFESRLQAEAQAARLEGIPNKVEQYGNRYFIRVLRPLNENESFIVNNTLNIEGAKSPRSWAPIQQFASWVRTPDDTLPPLDVANRKVAAYTQSKLLEWAKNNANSIGRLARQGGVDIFNKRWSAKIHNKAWNDWEEAARVASMTLDDKGQEGKFFDTPGEYEEFFNKVNGYFPDQLQIEAQFAFQLHMEADWMMRSLREASNRLRNGVEDHGFVVDSRGEQFDSPRFHGTVVQQLPNDKSSNILVLKKQTKRAGKDAVQATNLNQTSEGVSAERARWENAKGSLDLLEDNMHLFEELTTEQDPKRITAKLNVIDRVARAINKDVKTESNVNPTETDTALQRFQRAIKATRDALTVKQERKPIEAGKSETTPYTQPNLDEVATPKAEDNIAKRIKQAHDDLVNEHPEGKTPKLRELAQRAGLNESDMKEILLAGGAKVYPKGSLSIPKSFWGERLEAGPTGEGRFDPFASVSQHPQGHVAYATIGELKEAANDLLNKVSKFKEDKPSAGLMEHQVSDWGTLKYANRYGARQRALDQAAIKKGEKYLVRLWKASDKPFANWMGLKDQWVDYVLMDYLDAKQIDFKTLVGKRGGGHVEYNYARALRQAILKKDEVSGRLAYEGDRTFAVFKNNAEGKHFEKFMERARYLYNQNKMDLAKEAVHNLGMEWKEFEDLFIERKGSKGETLPPLFDKAQPFRMTEFGKNIIDLDPDLAERVQIDRTKHSDMARQFHVAFTGERDAKGLLEYYNSGNAQNPVWKSKPAERISPVLSMNRAMNRIIKSRAIEDYKYQAITGWLEEAIQDKLLKKNANQIRNAPFAAFYEAQNKSAWNWSKEKSDRIYMMMANNLKIRLFSGIQNDWEMAADTAAEKISDIMYKRAGRKSAGVAEKILENKIIPFWLIGKYQAPFNFARAFTFYAVMGFWSIPQLFVHAHTFTNIFALTKNEGFAAQGAMAGMLHLWTRFSQHPEIMKTVDKWAQHVGWKPGYFEEAMRELDNTSFLLEPGSTAMSDWEITPRMFMYNGQKVLHASTVFFRAPVKALRTVSYYTAYLEHRAKVPTGALTDLDRIKILNRGDDLAHNMSRASASTLHTGLLSWSAQFFSYFLRVAELFWSKRIGETPAERMKVRAKMLGYNAMLFGIPGAATVTGFPLMASVRDWLREEGVDDKEGWVAKALLHGLESFTMSLITAEYDALKKTGSLTLHPDPKASIDFDTASRYGSKGFEPLGQLWAGEEDLWTFLRGASANVVGNTIRNTYSFANAVISMMNRDGKHQLTADDIMDTMKEIRGVQNVRRLMQAIAFHKRLTNNEVAGETQSVTQAWFEFFSGLKDMETTHAWRDLQNIKDMNKHYQEMEFNAKTKILRGIRIMRTGDHAAGTREINNGLNELEGYPEHKKAGFFARMMKEAPEEWDSTNDRLWREYMENWGDRPDKNLDNIKKYQRYEESQEKQGRHE